MKYFFSLLIAIFAFSAASAKNYKTFSILGDSYSTYKGYVEPDTNYVWYADIPVNGTDVNSVDQTWWRQLAAKTGMRLIKNNSFSGSTICNRGYRGQDYKDRSFLTRLDKLGNPELIIVFGATNDTWANVPVEGETPDDMYALRPAMGLLLSEMKKVYPGADIIFVLNDEIQGEQRNAVLEECRANAVPCVELTLIDKISGHPSIVGMKKICDQIADFLENNK